MKWLVDEISRNERRIRKIAENPDPSKLACNRMLYELEHDLRKAQLGAAGSGTVALASGPSLIDPLLRSMGLQPLDLQGAADRLMVGDECIRAATEQGFPENACDRTLAIIGMYSQGQLPLPRLIVASNNSCDPLFLSYTALAQKFNVPLFCLDIPLEENEDSLQYVTAQLRELIGFIGTIVPGACYDESRMIELQRMNRQAINFLRDIHRMRTRIPCPLSTDDTFRIPHFPSIYPDPQRCLDYLRSFRDELMQKAEGNLGQEQLRVMWTCSAPYFANPFKVLKKHGANIVVFQIDIVARLYGTRSGGVYGDEFFGRKLSALEEEARMQFIAGWSSRGKKWVQEVIEVARELKIDALVNFMQVGCIPTSGLGRLLADELERELGIPTLNIEGRQLLKEHYGQALFEDTLEQFIQIAKTKRTKEAESR